MNSHVDHGVEPVEVAKYIEKLLLKNNNSQDPLAQQPMGAKKVLDVK